MEIKNDSEAERELIFSLEMNRLLPTYWLLMTQKREVSQGLNLLASASWSKPTHLVGMS